VKIRTTETIEIPDSLLEGVLTVLSECWPSDEPLELARGLLSGWARLNTVPGIPNMTHVLGPTLVSVLASPGENRTTFFYDVYGETRCEFLLIAGTEEKQLGFVYYGRPYRKSNFQLPPALRRYATRGEMPRATFVRAESTLRSL